MNDPVRVAVVDDQTLVREGFALLLGRLPGITIVGTAHDGHHALTVVAATSPDVVLLDLRMPAMDGVACTRAIRRRHPSTAVLLLTTYLHDSTVLAALRAGALGVVGKDASPEEVGMAIDAVRAGTPVLPASTQKLLLAARGAPVPRVRGDAETSTQPDLSPREREIVRLIAEGHSNVQIADHLRISTTTVKTHINNLFGKLQVRDRTSAVAAAAARDLLG